MLECLVIWIVFTAVWSVMLLAEEWLEKFQTNGKDGDK